MYALLWLDRLRCAHTVSAYIMIIHKHITLNIFLPTCSSRIHRQHTAAALFYGNISVFIFFWWYKHTPNNYTTITIYFDVGCNQLADYYCYSFGGKITYTSVLAAKLLYMLSIELFIFHFHQTTINISRSNWQPASIYY